LNLTLILNRKSDSELLKTDPELIGRDMYEDSTENEAADREASNDTAETWDHLCGPDPAWRAALEDEHE